MYYTMEVNLNRSGIKEFFKNQTVFITGGTGFLGKLLIEKLLRVCNDVELLCILVRDKKGMSARYRLDKLFQSPVFERMKIEQPDYRKKIKLIIGDITRSHFGLNEQDAKFLMAKTNCIINAAASVRFDLDLRTAILTNLRPLRDLLALAQHMRLLKSFVHVSTAYSSCRHSEICEDFYPMRYGGRYLLDMIDKRNEYEIEDMAPKIMKGWPNTYILTKAAAEDLIRRYIKYVPIAIVRPSIVTCVAEEPLPGWVDNIYGPIGVVVGAGIGVIRVIQADPANVADIVPGDYVINAILTTAWDTWERRDYLMSRNKAPIFNLASSMRNPITWGQLRDTLEDVGLNYYSIHGMWYYFFMCVPQERKYKFLRWLLHMLPAYIIDGGLHVLQKEKRIVKTYKKIHKFLDVLSYFAMREWEIIDDNMKDLRSRMSCTDRKLFYFDIAKLNWNEYLETCIKGGRIYLLKDPLSTVPIGQSKKKFFAVLHYTTICIVVLLFLQFLIFIVISIYRIM